MMETYCERRRSENSIRNSNTMFFSDRPADLSSLLVQAATAVGAVPGTDGTAAATKLLGRGKDAGSAGDPPP